MAKMKLQTSKVMSTNRAPGKPVSPSVVGAAQPVRPPMVSDVATENVKHFDTFCPGHPRPFVSVHRFGSDGQSGFSKKVPPVVTGRGRT